MSRFAVLILVVLPAAPAQVSAPNFTGWYVYNGDHKLSATSKWALHLEGQWRRNELITKPQQLLLRPGVNYTINKYLEIGGGYAYVPTYRYGSYPIRQSFTEHRLFQNLIVRSKIGPISFQNRLRLEQRFLRPVLKYENRIRHLIRGTVPLNGLWYVTAYNEVFIPFQPETHPAFADQNRTAALVGYQLNRHWRAEAGYLYQPVWQRNGRIREDNSTLLLMLFSDQPFSRSKSKK